MWSGNEESGYSRGWARKLQPLRLIRAVDQLRQTTISIFEVEKKADSNILVSF